MTHALPTQSVSSRLGQPESGVPGRVIHGPEFAIGTGRAVRGYFRWLVAVWVFGDEGEPAFGGFGDAAAFLAAQHRRSISRPSSVGFVEGERSRSPSSRAC